MRTTIGGIGVDQASATLTGISVYGNQQFHDWVKDGARVVKIVNPNGELQIEIEQLKGAS